MLWTRCERTDGHSGQKDGQCNTVCLPLGYKSAIKELSITCQYIECFKVCNIPYILPSK